MSTANEIIKIAKGEIGTIESPKNSNLQKYGKEYGVNGTAWCCQFVWWCFKHANASSLFYGGKKTAWVPSVRKHYTEKGKWIRRGDGVPKAGDLIIFGKRDSAGSGSHIGIVTSVTSSRVYTVEGNTTKTGFNANGGMVAAKSYGLTNSNIAGYCSIDYEVVEEPKDIYSNSVSVLTWQKAAMADGFKFPKYGADGEWGSECKAVAKKAICKKRLTYKYKNLTKLVQRIVGVTVDGKFGNATKDAVKAWQKAHGLTADGEVGLNTWTAMLRE